MRTADVGKLKFSSFDDLVGHDVAVRGISPWLVRTTDRVARAVEILARASQHGRNERYVLKASACWQPAASITRSRTSPSGCENIAAMGLSGKIEPLLSRSVIEDGYLCLLHQGARFARFGRCVLARVEAIQADRGVPGDISSMTFPARGPPPELRREQVARLALHMVTTDAT